MTKEQKKKYKIKDSKTDVIFYIVTGIILGILALIVIYPLYFILIASISDPNAIFNGEVYFLPVGMTLSGYEKLLEEHKYDLDHFIPWSFVSHDLLFELLMLESAGIRFQSKS